MINTSKKIFLWISLAVAILSGAALIYLSSLEYSSKNEDLSSLAAVILSIFALNLVTLFGLRFREKKWFIRSGLFSTALFLPLSVAFFIGIEMREVSEMIMILLLVLMCLAGLISVTYLFLIRDPGELRVILTVLILIVFFVVWNRLDLPYILTDALLWELIFVLTAGLYIYGLRCFLIIEKNRYLKVISFIGCALTAFGSFLFMLKMNGNNTSVFDLVYFIPAFLLTLIVLVSLPATGYFSWLVLHKKILKRISIAWIFILLIFSIRFIYPDLFRVMVIREEVESTQEFWLDDYKVPDKNGLEPE
jgi:hypothetical protein